jgi:restriction system protein
MAEVTARRIGELQRGVFSVLTDHAEGLAAKDVIERTKNIVNPTEFEMSDYPNKPGVQRFNKMIRFATISTVKAGWLIKEKGRWYLTEEGKQAYNRFRDPEEFRREAVRLFQQWMDNRPKDNLDIEDEGTAFRSLEDKRTIATATYEEAEEAAWDGIEKYVQTMPPFDLQKLVAALLRAMGYHVSWIAPPGPDKGIDIVAHNDPLGTSDPRIKVQVKRRTDKANVDGIRSFMAVLADRDVGIFVCTGGFTSEAESEARTKESRKLTLLDLEKLVDLWIKHYEKIEESDRALLPLKRVFYLAPVE